MDAILAPRAEGMKLSDCVERTLQLTKCQGAASSATTDAIVFF